MERKCEMKQFFPLCVAVSLHIFIPFRILISFFTSCFVRYICFALCLVDKTHKIDLKKKSREFILVLFRIGTNFYVTLHWAVFNTLFILNALFLFAFRRVAFFCSKLEPQVFGRNIQNSKPIKKLRHFEWLHCLFSIEFSWQETLSNSIQFLQMIKWEWKKVIPNYAIKIAFLQFNPKYLPQHR